MAGYDALHRPLPAQWRNRYRLHQSGLALRRYHVEPNEAPVTLFRAAADRDGPTTPERFWSRVALGPYALEPVPGHHRGTRSMLYPPQVAVLANRIGDAMDRALADWKPGIARSD